MKLSELKPIVFPGGECHLELGKDFVPPDVLTAHIRNSDDLLTLILATDVLKSRGCQPRVLELPYMPYARQDRRTTTGSPESLKVVADMINRLQYQKVRIYEPHSPTSQALLHNCEVVTFDEAAIHFIEDVLSRDGGPRDSVLLSPDAGAVTRVSRLQETTGIPMAVALKKRDPETGWLTIKEIFGDIYGKNVFILDDICDGGATFNQLAQYIRDHRPAECGLATSLHLFVGHGIFSKGITVLQQWYDTISTTDSFYIEDRVPPGTPRPVWVYRSF